jgi:lipoprotein-releasing system permease protein
MTVLFLALKSLLGSRLSLVLLLASVAAGVGFQIPNAANIEGYSAELRRHGLLRSTGHVVVSSPGVEPLSGVDASLARLRRLPFVRAATARLAHPGVVLRRGDHQAVRAVGIEPADEERASGFCRGLAKGRCFESQEGGGGGKGGLEPALVGAAIASKMALRPGDRAKLVLPHEDLGELRYEELGLRIEGVLEGGGGFQTDYDLFLRRRVLADRLGYADEASTISLFVDDPARSEAYAGLATGYVEGAKVEAWNRANPFIANAIEGNRTLGLISMTMVILAVGIPVLALLYIHVQNERRQIAILAALGFGHSALFAIYLIKAVVIGALGVALGIGIGLGLCAFFEAHPLFSNGGFVVRPLVSARTLAIPSLVLFGVTVLAGLAPAVRASRANPSLELRED